MIGALNNQPPTLLKEGLYSEYIPGKLPKTFTTVFYRKCLAAAFDII